MPTLDELPALLDQLNPGAYRFSVATSGVANGLRIERDHLAGFAFICAPTPDQAILVALHDFGPEHSEAWSTNSVSGDDVHARTSAAALKCAQGADMPTARLVPTFPWSIPNVVD
jgi:hypothetical protein